MITLRMLAYTLSQLTAARSESYYDISGPSEEMQGGRGQNQADEDEREGGSGESHKIGTEHNPKDSSGGIPDSFEYPGL